MKNKIHKAVGPITDQELELLKSSQTEEDWVNVCNTIKSVRGGMYPSNWFARIISSGLWAEMQDKWDNK